MRQYVAYAKLITSTNRRRSPRTGPDSTNFRESNMGVVQNCVAKPLQLGPYHLFNPGGTPDSIVSVESFMVATFKFSGLFDFLGRDKEWILIIRSRFYLII